VCVCVCVCVLMCVCVCVCHCVYVFYAYRVAAPESLPLILEPESRFYVDPVVVLDFQSLYPSIVIAYNYCFSTCLGRVHYLEQ